MKLENYYLRPLRHVFCLDIRLSQNVASETLLLLSDSLAAERTLYTPEDARKRRRMAPIAAAVAAATVAETAQGMYNDGCPEDSSVSLVEHAADQARMANLKVTLEIDNRTMMRLKISLVSKRVKLKDMALVFFRYRLQI